MGELCQIVFQGNNYICITRPRRFGKTVMANMIGSFFAKGVDSRKVFEQLAFPLFYFLRYIAVSVQSRTAKGTAIVEQLISKTDVPQGQALL